MIPEHKQHRWNDKDDERDGLISAVAVDGRESATPDDQPRTDRVVSRVIQVDADTRTIRVSINVRDRDFRFTSQYGDNGAGETDDDGNEGDEPGEVSDHGTIISCECLTHLAGNSVF